MFDRVSRFMSEQSDRSRPVAFRLAALSLGTPVFLIVIPFLLGVVARAAASPIPVAVPRVLEMAVGVSSLCFGLGLLAWSLLAFWLIGKGTPVPIAAPQKLVVRGPYRYSRNPIELGAILYYLGLGCLFLSFTAGLIMFLAGLVFGSVYHKFVEEPELHMRFGTDYDDYKKRVPFLIPRPWRKYTDT